MNIKNISFSPIIKSIVVTVLFLVLGEMMTCFSFTTPIYEITLLVVYLLCAYFFTKKVDGQPLKVLELSITKKNFRGFVFSLLLTAFIIFSGSVISKILFHDETFKLRGTVNFIGIVVTLILFFIESFIKQGFPEELIFRGYIVQTLRTKYNTIATMVISVGLFTLMHAVHILIEGFEYGLLVMFYAFSFACLAYLLKYLFGTTWAAVAVHGGVHMTRMTIMLIGFSETNSAILIHSILLCITSLILFFKFKDRYLED